MFKKFRRIYLFILLAIMWSCNTKQANKSDYLPKPKGFNRIDLPQNTYQKLPNNYPYSFEYNKEAVIEKDTFPDAEPFWIFINYKKYKAKVQLTYKPILGDKKRLNNMIADAHKLAFKHSVKAFGIQEKQYNSPSGYAANIIDLEGEVPSQVQFYMTDSTRHFLRGALYFETAVANDSLAPIIQYIRKDIIRLVDTIKWQQ